jgi:hypothetical protein
MSNKDWTGNQKSIYTTLGASNHTDKERETNDYYATEPKAVELLLNMEPFSHNIWECACGEGHLVNQMRQMGYHVLASDIINRGINDRTIDFLNWDKSIHEYNIITNPPYKYATQFCYKAIDLIDDGYKVAMFLKVQFLEGKERKKLFEKYPPKYVYISSSRLQCAKNGDFEKMKAGGGSAIAYAWYVWEKGYQGETILRWFN